MRAAGRPPYKQALVVSTIAVIMAALFVASYSLALSHPKPHESPTALVGDPGEQRPVILRLERAAGSGLQLRPYSSEAVARRAIDEQQVYAALVLDARPARLLVASASGASVSRVLKQAAEQAGEPLDFVDARPLDPRDPQGLVIFYVTLAATILGFVAMFQLRANASELSLRRWLAFVAGLAVIAGLALSTVVGPLLGVLHGPPGEVWAILSVEVAVAALFNSTMLVLVHRWAIIRTWTLFVLLGNTSSGGAVAAPLLPPFYAFVGRWLPPGATVEAVRTAAYFPHHQHAEPLLVLLSWLLAGLVALVVVARACGRGPAGG